MGERLPCKQEVTSSNLVFSIGCFLVSAGSISMYLENRIQERNEMMKIIYLIKTSEVIVITTSKKTKGKN